jgi:hypothetical protein
VEEIDDIYTSYSIATWRKYFPFFTCEVKCGAAALDVTDRQNAHSMTLAVRGIVELFRLVKREKELHQELMVTTLEELDVNGKGEGGTCEGCRGTGHTQARDG